MDKHNSFLLTGCPSTLKNKEGKTPRLLAKDNEHKDALKECRKAEKQSAKLLKGGSRTGEPYAIRVGIIGSKPQYPHANSLELSPYISLKNQWREFD